MSNLLLCSFAIIHGTLPSRNQFSACCKLLRTDYALLNTIVFVITIALGLGAGPSQYRRAAESGDDSGSDMAGLQPDMQRLMNPSVSMIATAATLAGLATAAGVPTTAAAFVSTAAVAARARWRNTGGRGSMPNAKQPRALIGTGGRGRRLLDAADAAFQRARCSSAPPRMSQSFCRQDQLCG